MREPESVSGEVGSLRALNHHLRIALDQVGEAVLITAAEPLEGDGPRILFCNRACVRLTGFRREDVLGRPLAALFDRGRIGRLLERLPVVAQSGKTFPVRAARLRTAAGDVGARWTVSGQRSPAGEATHFTFTVVEQDELDGGSESALAGIEGPAGRAVVPGPGEVVSGSLADGGGDGDAEALAQLSKTESLAFIASGIAHDFNNVLTPIIANLSLVEHDLEAGTAVRGRVADARRAADEARALARQILDFAKGERAPKEAAEVGRLVHEAARLATTGANVRCDVALAEGLWPAWIDTTQVLQVLNNLLINARQAMPGGGVAQASARNVVVAEGEPGGVAPGRYVEIRVRDRGCGIPPDDLENIFVAFFTTKEHGTGVGLATCRSIVRDHGGEITVRSKVGVGTEFRVLLPASDGGCAQHRREPAGAGVIEGEGSVLVVDDQDSIRTVAAAIIEKLGYEAIAVRNGEDALRVYGDRLRAGRPISVVLLDMTLPGGMSGTDTLEELLALDPAVRTIASSGYFDEGALASHRERGYVGILPKPYTVERLSHAVHAALVHGRAVAVA